MEENKGEFSERPEVTPAESVILPTQKKSKVATILCILFAIIAVGLGVFILCDKVLVKEEKTDKKPAETAKSEDVEKVAKYDRDQKIKTVANELRDVIKIYLDAEIDVSRISYNLYNPWGRVEEGKLTATTIPNGYTILIEGDTGSKAYEKIMNGGDFTLDDRIAESLKKQGFKKIDDLSTERMWSIQHYENDEGIVCEFSEAATIPYDIDCADSSNITEETKTMVKGLAKAYKDKTGEEATFFSAEKENIVDGANGYQRLFASGENAAALFYRKSSDSDWVYFTMTQAALDCGEFNTDDLKNAYSGYTCWDEATNSQSTVKAAN